MEQILCTYDGYITRGTDDSLAQFGRSKLDRHVRGILTNVLALLFKLGWNPKMLNAWVSPQGNSYELEAAKNNIQGLLYALIDSYNDLHYVRASNHYDGKGMQFCVNWQYTLSLTYAMRKSKESTVFSRLAALETVMSAASWPQTRVGQTTITALGEERCQLCGADVRDSLLTFWNCSYINDLDCQYIQDTNHLAPLANQRAEEFACCWLRGIMPKSFAQIPEGKERLTDRFYCIPP